MIATNPFYKRVDSTYPILLADEQFSIFYNSDPFDNTDFGDYRLIVLSCPNDTIEIDPLAGLNQYVIQGNEYRVYIENAVIPAATLNDGYYRLCIVNSLDEIIVYFNPFEFTNNSDYAEANSTKFRFRHFEDRWDYNYTGLPQFFNKYRLRVYQKEQPTYEFDRVEYVNTETTAIRSVQANRDRQKIKLLTYFGDELMNEAFERMTAHSEVLIEKDGLLQRIQSDSSSGLTIETDQEFVNGQALAGEFYVNSFSEDVS